jgi:DNA-binding protein H-NS
MAVDAADTPFLCAWKSDTMQLSPLDNYTMATLKELIAQKEALEAQIAETRQSELAEAIAQVKSLVEDYGLTVADIFGGSVRRAKSSEKKISKVAAKYKDPISGKTWSGRGIAPKWLAGKNKEDYAIA